MSSWHSILRWVILLLISTTAVHGEGPNPIDPICEQPSSSHSNFAEARSAPPAFELHLGATSIFLTGERPSIGDTLSLSGRDLTFSHMAPLDRAAIMEAAAVMGIEVSPSVQILLQTTPEIHWAKGEFIFPANRLPTDMLVLGNGRGYLVVALADTDPLTTIYGGVSGSWGDEPPEPESAGRVRGSWEDPDANCYLVAYDHCGSEPMCSETPAGPGIMACVDAARCGRAKCLWAGCFEQTVRICNPVALAGVLTPDSACSAIAALEIAGCLPAYVLSWIR